KTCEMWVIMDTDFHKIITHTNETINSNKEIIIKDKVWIGCRCTILKGTIVEKGNVIAANTVISGIVNHQNSVIGGNPNRLLKNNIKWLI
ncbi:hypothetical protein ABES27_14835, partial [Heyndrickxia coagulans]